LSPILSLGESSEFTEKKLGEGTLAVWELVALPADATVTRVTLVPFRGERLAFAWKGGAFLLPEDSVRPGESVSQAIDRIGLEQAGLIELTPEHLGHFRCRATSYQTELAPGTITYQALYGVAVGGLADFPAIPGFERRMARQRDLMALLRDRYFEVAPEYMKALDKYIIQRLRDQAAVGTQA
jgi:hypothetical protein